MFAVPLIRVWWNGGDDDDDYIIEGGGRDIIVEDEEDDIIDGGSKDNIVEEDEHGTYRQEECEVSAPIFALSVITAAVAAATAPDEDEDDTSGTEQYLLLYSVWLCMPIISLSMCVQFYVLYTFFIFFIFAEEIEVCYNFVKSTTVACSVMFDGVIYTNSSVLLNDTLLTLLNWLPDAFNLRSCIRSWMSVLFSRMLPAKERWASAECVRVANVYGSSMINRVNAPPYTYGKMFVTYSGLSN